MIKESADMGKIFIVEDEWIVVLELQHRVRDLGYEVVGTADNGDTAIRLVLETKPDLILMDINLKGDIDGIETSRQILQKYNVPIIYLTAYSDKATLERAKFTAPYGYILKPVEERDLHFSIEISLTKFQMEKKLRESEKNLSITLQSIGDGVIATDEKYLIKRMNTIAEKMCGWSFEDAIGRPLNQVFNIISALNRKPLDNPVEEVLRTGNIVSLTNHTILISRDGTERHIADSAAPIRDDSGEIQGIVLVFSDVTESYKNRELLKQSEKSYREVIENASDIIYMTDQFGRFIHANAAALRLTGYSQEDIESRSFLDMVAPEYRTKVKRHYYRQFLEKKSTTYTELPIIRKNGEISWFGQNVTLLLEEDNIKGFHVISRDISDRKKAEDSIRESERRFQTLANVSPVGIFRTDATGYTTYVNPRWCEISGLTAEKAVGDGWLAAVHEEDKVRLFDEWKLAAQSKRASSADYRFLKSDGSIAWVMGHAVPELNEENQIVGYVGTITDITERKLIEDALRESENIFNQFMMHSPIYVYFKDHNGRPLRLSKNFEQLVGIPTEQMIGKTMYELFPSDFAKNIVEDDLKVLREGKQIEIEEKLNGKYYTTIKFPICQGDQPCYLAGYTIDISERKKAEFEIKRLANALRSINECVSITTLDNKLTFVNQSFLNTYGYEEKELIGQDISILGSPNNPPGIAQEILDATLANGWKGELLNRKKDGSEFPIHLSTTNIFDDNNNPIALIGVAVDITLRKLNEAEITKLNQAVIQSPTSIIITDLKGNIEYVNPKVCETTGYSKEELIGKNPRIFSSQELSKDSYRILWETINSGKEWRGEFHNKKKNGELFWEYASISPIINKSELITHFLAVKENITERKNLELGLIEAKEKAEAASELKDAFIANISHEIRTPLNGVLGMTSIIKDVFSQYITPKEEQYFVAINRSSRRIIRTIDMILNFSRLQVGDLKSDPRIVNLDELLNELYMEFNIPAQQKGLVLTFENKIGEVQIQSDTYCLNQVIANLVDNAIKYTITGSIKIILYRDHENKIKIDVEDTGIGISEDYMDQLFQPYTQEEIGYTRAYDGVGLGLSLVKKFLNLIEAEISVKSKKEVGSIFTIIFKESTNVSKAIEFDKSTNDHQPKKSEQGLKPKRNASILIVEDEEVNQLFLSVKLAQFYNVIIVDSATKALESLEDKRFDVILMDISLKGGLNGIELTKILRETNEYSKIPIIAITGYAFNQDRERCLAAGCNDYISKPFQIEDLEEKIQQFLTIK